MGSQSSSTYDEDENVNLTNYNLTQLPFTPSGENKTKYLYLSGNNLNELPKNLENLILLDLSNNKIGSSLPPKISKALSTYSNLKTLYLSKNRLENLDDLENKSVTVMYLTQNSFRELPYQFLSKFPQLQTVYLDCNFINSFSKQSSGSVISLNFSLNCIRTIEVSTLNLPKLQILNLSKNQIRKLPNNFSKSFPELQNLDLTDNFIEEIPEGDSVFPQTLKELNLSNNLIEKVPNSITSLPKLTNLTIANNKITFLPQLNSSLEKLFASENQIKKIENQQLNFLKEISLEFNELTSFPTELNALNATTIFVDHNKIAEVNVNSVYKNLTTIDLSFNQIKTIKKELFEYFPNLQKFTAHFNKITDIPSEISNCKNLFALEISFNPLKKLPKLPRSLSILSVSNCQLQSFDESNFVSQSENSGSIQLRQLDLSGNEIDSLTIIPSVQILNVSQNKLTKMPVLTPALKIVDLSMNRLETNVTSMPLTIASDTLVDLNLSHNKLTKLPTFERVPLLQYLEISDNPLVCEFDVSRFPFLERIDASCTSSFTVKGTNSTLNEVITSSRDFDDENKHIYVNVNKSGYSEFLGLRSGMEDSIILRDDINLYAVFDGHGGCETAKVGSIEMSKMFENEIQTKQLKFDSPTEIFLEIFQKVEDAIKQKKLKDGSTLCLAYIATNESEKNKKKVVTAHLGDARALIVLDDGKAREITKDHKPTSRSEFERIHNMNGRLSKDNRVDGVLAVSRSIGDFEVYGVGREPEVGEFEIGEKDKFLVIGCDGVFDVLSNEDVARIAVGCKSTKEAAFLIRNAAFASKSADNISVIVVDLTN